MSKQKSPIDELFFDFYGYYPNKAGQAYEIIVAAAIKIVTGQNIKYDQHYRGEYSKTDYQIDAINEDEQKVIEAKDYTIDNRKVGRSDIQKLQGALTDLSAKGGVFASATNYTKPAQKYANSAELNPLQKQIQLYQIRPSEEIDEKGRIKTFIINMNIIVPDYSNAIFNIAWTNSALKQFVEKSIANIQISTDCFYKEDGTVDCLLTNFTYENQPIHINIDDEFALGCWLFPNSYIKYNDSLFGIKGIDYKIPYKRSARTFKIEREGTPRILVKSDDGTIDQLLTDKQFKDLIIKDGEVK